MGKNSKICALLQKIKIIGIDKDKEVLSDAKKNLEWANFPKENYRLINEDSTKVKTEKADVIVTEPHLGVLLKEIPSGQESKIILNDFDNLIIQVLKNLKNNIRGKIVFTAPLIKIKENKKRMACNIIKIIQQTGLRGSLINKSPAIFQEIRDDQIVARNIFVLENK